MRKKRDKPEYIDDGRVIASMNVDGMPWYSKKRTADTESTAAEETADETFPALPEEMTRRERLAFIFGVLRAVFLIALVFIGGLYLFIIFCINVWFA